MTKTEKLEFLKGFKKEMEGKSTTEMVKCLRSIMYNDMTREQSRLLFDYSYDMDICYVYELNDKIEEVKSHAGKDAIRRPLIYLLGDLIIEDGKETVLEEIYESEVFEEELGQYYFTEVSVSQDFAAMDMYTAEDVINAVNQLIRETEEEKEE